MKGFKKDGKFRPTGNRVKSSLKKSDMKKQTIGVNEANSLLRTKKTIKNDIKIIGINFWTADNYDVDYHINGDGEVVYEGGINEALNSLGASRLSPKQIRKLIEIDDDTDVTEQEFFKNEREAVNDYVREKQDDHSDNIIPATEDSYNFGFFQISDRPYLSITSDNNDNDDGIYDLMYIADEEGIGEDSQRWYAGALLNPELTIGFEKNGKKYEIKKSNEKDGKWQELQTDDNYVDEEDSVIGEYGEDLDSAIHKFTNGGST